MCLIFFKCKGFKGISLEFPGFIVKRFRLEVSQCLPSCMGFQDQSEKLELPLTPDWLSGLFTVTAS